MKEDLHLEKNEFAELIRSTVSVCPQCLRESKSEIVKQDDAVIMKKHCPQHGAQAVILSRESHYYIELSKAYFALMPSTLPRKHMAITLTSHCSLGCPICFAVKTMGRSILSMGLEDIETVLRSNPDKEFMLWGMEPTEHPQIMDVLRTVRRHGKKCHMLTNGLRLQDIDFVRQLQASGLGQLCLQFDGFDDAVHQTIRGRPLSKEKMAVLDNLKRLGVPTSLEVVLVKGVNEGEIDRIIKYAINNPHIRQINFSPLIYRGGSYLKTEEVDDPGYHTFLRSIEAQTAGRISLQKLRAFQKLMYVVYRITRFKRCFYYNLYILVRGSAQDSYKTIDEYFDLFRAEMVIDRALRKLKGKPDWFFDLTLGLKLIPIFLNGRCWGLFQEFLKFVLRGKRWGGASGAGLLCITYNEFCDTFKMDIGMSEDYCQDIVALKDRSGHIVYKACYKIMLEDCAEKGEPHA